MAINYVPLDKAKHKDIKVEVDGAFTFAKNTHLAAASIREFAHLAGAMPIVFIKDPNTENYHSVAMLGVEPGQNLFLLGERWEGPHVPMNILRYPFDVRPDGEKLGVYIDENSELINDKGMALFTENGEEASDFLNNRQKLLSDLANSEIATQRFVKRVVELDLLEPVLVRVLYQDGAQRNVTGMYALNEKKLLELEDDVVIELHKAGFLGAAYATMMSISQLNRLVELGAKAEKPIRSMQFTADKGEEGAEAPKQ